MRFKQKAWLWLSLAEAETEKTPTKMAKWSIRKYCTNSGQLEDKKTRTFLRAAFVLKSVNQITIFYISHRQSFMILVD